MSYPDPVYFGETGEASATFRSVDHGRPSDEEMADFYLRHDNVWLDG